MKKEPQLRGEREKLSGPLIAAGVKYGGKHTPGDEKVFGRGLNHQLPFLHQGRRDMSQN